MTPQDITFLALTIWKEASGESLQAKRAVCHVILNRVKDKRWQDNVFEVCLAPVQFSCYHSRGENNTVRWPFRKNTMGWRAWEECLELAAMPGEDPTQGANHYFNPNEVVDKPRWADATKYIGKWGKHEFYKL